MLSIKLTESKLVDSSYQIDLMNDRSQILTMQMAFISNNVQMNRHLDVF